MKAERHAKILELIKSQSVETQEDLTALLRGQGFNATQATVSRDIKELGLVKVAVKGKNRKDTIYKYAVNSSRSDIDSRLTAKFRNILAETIVKMSPAGQLVVLKTYAGMAQAAGAAIDALNSASIIGCIAGDDTLLVVMSDEEQASDFVRRLSKSIKSGG